MEKVKLLEERIKKDGKALGKTVLKVIPQHSTFIIDVVVLLLVFTQSISEIL